MSIDLAIEPGPTGRPGTGAQWEFLARDTGAAPFLWPTWFRLWWDAFGSGHPHVIVARRDDRLVGALPVRSRAGVWATMSNTHSPFFAEVAEDDEVATLLWSEAMRRSVRRLSAQGLREPAARRFEDGARASGRRAWVRHLHAEPDLDLAGTTWDDYTASRSANLRKQLRRAHRRIEDSGRVSFELHRGTDVLDHLDEAFRIEASGWKGASGTAMASQPHTERFYRELAAWGAAEDWLRLGMLRLDGVGISFELLAAHRSTWYGVKVGFDEAHAAASPGSLVLEAVLRAAIDHGVARYDFAGEANSEIERWATGSSEVRRMEAFRRATGALDRLALTRARPVLKQLRDRRRSAATS